MRFLNAIVLPRKALNRNLSWGVHEVTPPYNMRLKTPRF